MANRLTSLILDFKTLNKVRIAKITPDSNIKYFMILCSSELFATKKVMTAINNVIVKKDITQKSVFDLKS